MEVILAEKLEQAELTKGLLFTVMFSLESLRLVDVEIESTSIKKLGESYVVLLQSLDLGLWEFRTWRYLRESTNVSPFPTF